MLAEVALTFSATEMCPPNLSQVIVKVLVHTAQPDLAFTCVTTLTSTFLVRVSLMITGSLLHLYCYWVLGHFFTFELSIHQEHKLMETGIYSVMQHPSYLGSLNYFLGEQLAFFDKNSWLLTCSGLAGCNGYMLTCLLWALTAIMVHTLLIFLHSCMDDEDTMLERHFGKEWRDWAKRAPYRVVPWVY
ncbi:hypothetical protein ID866_9343 [Astraeus odoratus]|nr:hypothetical protein ID866_9343 [Astraeus odoratus]